MYLRLQRLLFLKFNNSIFPTNPTFSNLVKETTAYVDSKVGNFSAIKAGTSCS